MGRVVVVGLDGATLDVMRPMFQQGRLKNFAKMVDAGTSGVLTSTILPLSATAWNTFATGRNPGKHGIYDFSRRIPGTYSHAPTTSHERGGDTLWKYASAAGKKCLIVNVPLTYPPEAVNGIMISGFPYPESRGDYAIPQGILGDIKRDLGITHLHKPSPHFLKPGDEGKLLKEMLLLTADQAKVVTYLMKREQPWDLLVTVFDATDVVSHFFWRYIDKNNPKYNEKEASEFGPLFYDVYDAVDRAFGEISKELTPDDSVFVISDHGFGPVYYAVYMNNWLMENHYLRLKRTAGTQFRKGLFKVGITTDFLFRAAKKMGIVSTKTYTYSKKSRSLELAKKLSLSLDDIDWGETLVYSYGNYGQFFLNVAGREPQGRVAKGQEYDRLVTELMGKLKELRDPKTGRILFDIIYRKDEIYSGPYFDQAPDIVFFDSTMTYRAHRLFEFGSRSMIGPDPIYSGSHRMDGVLLASGNNIAHTQTFEGASLIDLPPTILHLLDMPVPADMDGRVLTGLFPADSRYSQRSVRTVDDQLISSIRRSTRKLAGTTNKKI